MLETKPESAAGGSPCAAWGSSMSNCIAAGQRRERLLQARQVAETPIQPVARARVGIRTFIARVDTLLGKPRGEPGDLGPEGRRGGQLGEARLAGIGHLHADRHGWRSGYHASSE